VEFILIIIVVVGIFSLITSLNSDDTIKFGKYKGYKYKDISDSYLIWLSENMGSSIANKAKDELRYRKLNKYNLSQQNTDVKFSSLDKKFEETRELLNNTQKKLDTHSKLSLMKDDLEITLKSPQHNSKNKNEIGQEYERKVGKHYEKKGYSVTYRGIELGVKDGGIDLIASNKYEILLIQCKFWKDENSITHKMVKEFFGNCNFYINNNPEIQTKKVKSIYVVPNHKIISRSAYYIFKENYVKCRYQVIN